MTEMIAEHNITELAPAPEMGAEDITGSEDLGELSLEELRMVKDECDKEIIEALLKRQVVTDTIGARKRERGEPVHAISEEHRVLARVGEAAREAGLNPRTVISLWVNLFGDSRERQRRTGQKIGNLVIADGNVSAGTKDSPYFVR